MAAKPSRAALIRYGTLTKAMAAMMEHCRGPGRGRRVLFWNTYNGQDTMPLLEDGQKKELPPAVVRWLQTEEQG